MKTDLLSKEEIFKHVYYNPESKTGLSYVEKQSKRYSGDAGHFSRYYSKNRKGQPHMIRVTFDGESYPAHRIIWILINGQIKIDHIIDHVDGNPFNNSIENLREIHKIVNARNAKMREDNTTGVTGVFKSSSRGIICFLAGWYDGFKMKTKMFSTRKYGFEEAFRLACEHRKLMIDKLNLEGAGYTDRHGTIS
jgi:hypothetical protein